MKRIAESFSWPFRGTWRATWAIGSLLVLLAPVAFIPLLGYAVAATRAAIRDPLEGPPLWSLSGRLLTDGFWTALVLGLVAAPFALAERPLAAAIDAARLWHVSDAPLSAAYAGIAAIYLLALPWGLLLLIFLPHATRRFAESGKPIDLFDFLQSARDVRAGFPTWNVAAAAIVTGWAVGLACSALLCVGLFPGLFYAILVSAHASAALGTRSQAQAGA